MNYLTVQDLVWINSQVAGGTPQDFHFMKLEEGTFFQYAYGSSSNLLDQAARFLAGFTAKAPFAKGNEATAFIGCLTFLLINGAQIALEDESGKQWFSQVAGGNDTGLKDLVSQPDVHHLPSVAEAAKHVFESYPATIAALSSTVHA